MDGPYTHRCISIHLSILLSFFFFDVFCSSPILFSLSFVSHPRDFVSIEWILGLLISVPSPSSLDIIGPVSPLLLLFFFSAFDSIATEDRFMMLRDTELQEWSEDSETFWLSRERDRFESQSFFGTAHRDEDDAEMDWKNSPSAGARESILSLNSVVPHLLVHLIRQAPGKDIILPSPSHAPSGCDDDDGCSSLPFNFHDRKYFVLFLTFGNHESFLCLPICLPTPKMGFSR